MSLHQLFSTLLSSSERKRYTFFSSFSLVMQSNPKYTLPQLINVWYLSHWELTRSPTSSLDGAVKCQEPQTIKTVSLPPPPFIAAQLYRTKVPLIYRKQSLLCNSLAIANLAGAGGAHGIITRPKLYRRLPHNMFRFAKLNYVPTEAEAMRKEKPFAGLFI